MGDGGDLEIYHDGNNSVIRELGTGLLSIQSSGVNFLKYGTSEYFAQFATDGSVSLYYDNSKKLETTGYGATVYGTLQSQQANVSGIVTASAFYGDGSNLSGIVATNATNVIGGIASITSLNVSGISTLGTLKVSSGIVTATSGIITYYGDGSKLTGLTAQARVVASQTPPTSPTEGDLWYHTTVARLFVYFNDGDSNQWVDASPFNLTGSGGGTNVSVGATAPIAPIIGDLWYNSDYGRLFVYYQDEDSNQWVDAAPFNLPTNNEPAKTENSFIATPGQTTFTVSYEVGFVEVYLNGIRLSSGEFNASSGVSIILNDPATEGDVVDVIEIATGRGPTGPRGSGGPLENVTVATDNNTYYPIFAVGVGTTTPYINTTSGYLNYNPSSGTLNVNQLNVGVTTLGVTTATNLTVQSINCSGVATALDFNSTSDVNLKKDVKVIDDPVAKVLQLNGVSFNWTDTGQSSAGVIAQDVEKVMPEIIRDNPTGYKSLNYNGLIGLLIEAVKEQNETIKSLEQKINTLEERLS